MSHCSIVPPYLLDALAGSPDQELARRAGESLRLDERHRSGRSPQATGRPAPSARPESTPETAGPHPNRIIGDAAGQTLTPGTIVRREGEPVTDDIAVTEAYDALGLTWTMWHQVFGRDSLDGRAMPLRATVHYGQNYDNAFWDGRQMVFGDGDQIVFQRFTRSIDVIGHELAHGVTEFTAGLRYAGQSGALNESISDVFGSLVKQHAAGQSANRADWLIGADLLTDQVNGRALRDMLNPGTAYDDPRLGKDPQPAHMTDYVVTDDDNGGVHLNSGIPNRAFALAALAIGGNAWQGAGAIWWAAVNGDGIRADCDFATFAELTVSAAPDERSRTAVREAWQSVGVATGTDDTAAAPRRGARHGIDQDPTGRHPGPDTTITLRRSGGFTGLVTERRLRLDELPAADVRSWQSLLAAPARLTVAADTGGAPGAARRPDAFQYQLSCPDCNVDLVLGEPELSDTARTLFQRALARPVDGTPPE